MKAVGRIGVRLSTQTVFLLLVGAPTLLAGCGGDGDGDRDGLQDSKERSWTLTVDFMTERVTVKTSSDGGKADTDGDGLDDLREYIQGSHPRDNDTDDDGLSDCQEIHDTRLAVCLGTDMVSVADGGYGTNPARADSDPGPARLVNRPGYFRFPPSADAPQSVQFGDGLSDGQEVFGYEVEVAGGARQRVTSDPRDVDSDLDYMEDGEEALLYGGDPTVKDSDGDGCDDGEDPVPLREERIAFGTLVLNLSSDADGDGRARVSFVGQAASRVFSWPSQPRDVRVGVPTEFPDFAAGAQRPAVCEASPLFPW